MAIHHCDYWVHSEAYRCPFNLRDLLLIAANGQLKEMYEGNSRCHQPHCKICANIRTGTTFYSMTTGKKFQVKASPNCQSRNEIYVIECAKCSIQCVVETENALHICLPGHRSNIRHNHKEKPVANKLTQWITRSRTLKSW